MDNVAVALQLDSTQIAIGFEKKDKIIVKKIIKLPSIIPDIFLGDESRVNSFFKRMTEVLPKNAQVSMSIPTSMAIMNCGMLENVPQEQPFLNKELDRSAYRLLHLEEKDQYNVDKALIIKQRKNIRLTSVGVPKRYIDIIWNAATEAKIIVKGIEIEAIAAFRFEGFIKPCCYLEMQDQSFYFTGHLPENGLFTIKSRFLGRENIKTALLSAIELFDDSVERSFGQKNIEKFSIITPTFIYDEILDCLYETDNPIRLRPTILSQDIESNEYDEDQLIHAAVALGILLEPLFERRNQREKIRISKSSRK